MLLLLFVLTCKALKKWGVGEFFDRENLKIKNKGNPGNI